MDFFIAILNSIIVGLLLVLALLYLFIKKKQNYWSERGVPYVKAESLVYGNLKEVMINKKNMFDKYKEIYSQFEGEPYCGLYEFHYPVLMLRDPQLIQAILTEKFTSFERPKMVVQEGADEIISYNPFLMWGQKWKDTRAMIAAGLTPNKLRALEEISSTVSQEMYTYIDNNPNDIEVYTDLVSRFNSEMVANYGWGIKSNGFLTQSVLKKAFDLVSFASSSTFELMWLHPFLSKILRLRFIPKELSSFLQSITEQVANKSKTTDHNSFLQHLLNFRDKLRSSGKDMSIKELAGHMGTFFTDGYETTSRVLSFVIYCLMLHPDMQRKMKEEIMKVEEATIEGVSKLQYMDMFISEVFRCYPVLVYTGRFCTKKCKLGSLDVEEGTAVIIPIGALHSDPNIYPEPNVFNPENFSEENKNKRHKYTFFPFGQGLRMCVGMRYALANMKLLLFYILRHYDVVPPKDHPVHKLEHNPAVRVVYANKDPLYVRFKKIN